MRRRRRQPPVRIQPRAERAAEERGRAGGDERDGKQGLINGGGRARRRRDRSRGLAASSEEAHADVESVIAREGRGRGALEREAHTKARGDRASQRAKREDGARARPRALHTNRDGDDDRDEGGARRLRERRRLLRSIRARLFDLPDDELGLELLQRGDDLALDNLRRADRSPMAAKSEAATHKTVTRAAAARTRLGDGLGDLHRRVAVRAAREGDERLDRRAVRLGAHDLLRREREARRVVRGAQRDGAGQRGQPALEALRALVLRLARVRTARVEHRGVAARARA